MTKPNYRRMVVPPLSVISVGRYLSVIFVVLVSLHYILRFTDEEYGRHTSVPALLDQIGLSNGSVTGNIPSSSQSRTDISPGDRDPALAAEAQRARLYPQRGKANATFMFLARNSDLEGVVTSVRQMEDRFNRKYNYPWVFLNDEPFSEEFIRRVRVLSNAKMQFGLIPSEHWVQPEWIDEEKAQSERNQMSANGIIYGGSVPYRNMCRFNSGFFYRHEMLLPYRYYWRVEPQVQYFCDLNYDPFAFMEEQNKTYGFTLSMLELAETIRTLWSTVKEFVAEHPQYVAPNNALAFLSDNNGYTYNNCHFWSNFEIADMDFWRSEVYSAFFDYLEAKGGFYYERWGDAPVHSIAVALFIPKDSLHFFSDIGYQHESFGHCPMGDEWADGRCSCNTGDTFDYSWGSCLPKWDRVFS